MEVLNEDWVGEDVWSIDDARVPDVIHQHGERFRNPARYVIKINPDEFALYGGMESYWTCAP